MQNDEKFKFLAGATLLQLLDFQVQMRKVSKVFNSLSPPVQNMAIPVEEFSREGFLAKN